MNRKTYTANEIISYYEPSDLPPNFAAFGPVGSRATFKPLKLNNNKGDVDIRYTQVTRSNSDQTADWEPHPQHKPMQPEHDIPINQQPYPPQAEFGSVVNELPHDQLPEQNPQQQQQQQEYMQYSQFVPYQQPYSYFPYGINQFGRQPYVYPQFPQQSFQPPFQPQTNFAPQYQPQMPPQYPYQPQVMQTGEMRQGPGRMPPARYPSAPIGDHQFQMQEDSFQSVINPDRYQYSQSPSPQQQQQQPPQQQQNHPQQQQQQYQQQIPPQQQPQQHYQNRTQQGQPQQISPNQQAQQMQQHVDEYGSDEMMSGSVVNDGGAFPYITSNKNGMQNDRYQQNGMQNMGPNMNNIPSMNNIQNMGNLPINNMGSNMQNIGNMGPNINNMQNMGSMGGMPNMRNDPQHVVDNYGQQNYQEHYQAQSQNQIPQREPVQFNPRREIENDNSGFPSVVQSYNEQHFSPNPSMQSMSSLSPMGSLQGVNQQIPQGQPSTRQNDQQSFQSVISQSHEQSFPSIIPNAPNQSSINQMSQIVSNQPQQEQSFPSVLEPGGLTIPMNAS